MIWTHIYDLFLKLITMFLVFILLEILHLEKNIIIHIVLAIVLFLIIYTFIFRTIATYLYCRLTLKMNVSLEQAKNLNGAFSPIFPLNFKWLPMKELKSIDNNIKYETAIGIYQKWQKENKTTRVQYIDNFKNSQLKIKLLTLSGGLLIGYFIIASFFNIPPASWVTEIFCKLFETQTYSPILNCILLILPTVLIFIKIEKKIK